MRSSFKIELGVFLAFSFLLPVDFASAQTNSGFTVDLSLDEYLHRVLENNETVQVKMLEVEINRRKYRGEYGVFEPELVNSYEHEENNRQTGSIERRNLGGLTVFEEKNDIFNSGLESLVPTGARIRLGYSLRSLENNLQGLPSFFGGNGFTNGEYQTFFGFTLTQPLLKNAWWAASTAGIRAAGVASEIGFEEYRRQMMITLSTAEATYWNLYQAQQQLIFLQESVNLAETILKDNQERLKAGKGSEMEVLQAEAGLALRRTKLSEALQRFHDTRSRLLSLSGDNSVITNKLVIASDTPQITEAQPSLFDSWQKAFDLNPDYLGQRKKLTLENVRLAYSKNQRLPQLDLKSSYGLNGLGDSPNSSWEQVTRTDFPSWTVGVEMHIPLFGGVKSRNELAAAKLRVKQALISLKEIENQISNGLESALRKLQGSRDSTKDYRKIVSFNENLLKAQMASLEVGKVESRKVLEVDADLFEAKSALAEAQVAYVRALLEMELIEGSLLQKYHVDLTRRELEQRTAKLVTYRGITDEQYKRFIKDILWAYQQKGPPMNNNTEQQVRNILKEKTANLDKARQPPPPTPEEQQDKALMMLRQKIRELNR